MAPDTEYLAKLIDAKHACLRQLHELGHRQLESIAAREFGQLMKILAGKQRLLEGLQEVERQLDPFRGQSPESRPWPSAQQREQCAAAARSCEQLLSEIVIQEKQSERLLAEDRDEAARRLHGAHAASQAQGAYATASESSHRQLDLCSES